MLKMYCWKEDILSICKPMPDDKFWCTKCDCHVIPDEHHSLYYTKGTRLLWVKGAGRDYKAEPIQWALAEAEGQTPKAAK